MVTRERPRGLNETTLIMSITNAMGWSIIDWSEPRAWLTFTVFSLFIGIGYVVIWFYWKGHNWARVLVLLSSLLAVFNLHVWNRAGIAERIMIGTEGALAVFLLYWLNTSRTKAFFAKAGHE